MWGNVRIPRHRDPQERPHVAKDRVTLVGCCAAKASASTTRSSHAANVFVHSVIASGNMDLAMAASALPPPEFDAWRFFRFFKTISKELIGIPDLEGTTPWGH